MATIVVGIDGSETAEQAAREAARLANAMSAQLRLVTAYRPHGHVDVDGAGESWHLDSISEAEQLLKNTATSLALDCDHQTSARAGKPADALVAEATDTDASYIVVGNKRVSGPSRLLGSVATAVLRDAPCSVVVVKTT